MTTTIPDTNPDELAPINEAEETVSDALGNSEIYQLSAEMEAAKQALADAEKRYTEAVQDATGNTP